MMIMHAAFDFGGKLKEIAVDGGSQLAVANSTPEGALITLMLTLPLFLYGMFILWKVAPTEPPGNTSDSFSFSPPIPVQVAGKPIQG